MLKADIVGSSPALTCAFQTMREEVQKMQNFESYKASLEDIRLLIGVGKSVAGRFNYYGEWVRLDSFVGHYYSYAKHLRTLDDVFDLQHENCLAEGVRGPFATEEDLGNDR